MHCVYVIRSVSSPARKYVGMTSNIVRRLEAHGAGQVIPTARFRPWRLLAAFWFEDAMSAAVFEKCLKSGSGRAFVKKHLIDPSSFNVSSRGSLPAEASTKDGEGGPPQ